MFRYCIILCLLFAHSAFAQVMEGTVLDVESKSTIPGVNISNKRSGMAVNADNDGRYSIQGRAGDTLLFSHLSYQQATEVMNFSLGVRYKTILLLPLAHNLKEIKITGRTKYQQDSIARRDEYGHELNKAPVPKPQYTGVGCAGCVGWIADKITGNSKIPNRFKKEFAADEKQHFTDSRYTFELVTLLTGIRDTDSVAAFIYYYPMEYDFARTATDLEIKVWIRENYKQYRQTAFVKRPDDIANQ